MNVYRARHIQGSGRDLYILADSLGQAYELLKAHYVENRVPGSSCDDVEWNLAGIDKLNQDPVLIPDLAAPAVELSGPHVVIESPVIEQARERMRQTLSGGK